MNERLKFSWGHIIAALALIFMTYLTFMGTAYRTRGSFLWALVVSGVVLIVLIGIFIGAQRLKITDRKFRKRIGWERALVWASPFVFCGAMIPAAHFWNVFSKSDEVEWTFRTAIQASKGMFSNYEQYTIERRDDFRTALLAQGLTEDNYRLENRMEALRLQLRSANYEKVKEYAFGWIDKADAGVSVWNVFLLGNVRQIESAMESWHAQLFDFSQHQMQGESFGSFDPEGVYMHGVLAQLEQVRHLFSASGRLRFEAVLMGILCYAMLLLPYLLQERHTKSTLHFWNGKAKDSAEAVLSLDEAFASGKSKDLEDSEETPRDSQAGTDGGNYTPFTL